MGNCTSKSAISSQNSSSSKESLEIEEIPSFQWSELPPNVVERIYSFLGRKDQSSMSQVCKTWSTEYSSPSLWRHIKFFVPERIITTDLHPAVRAAQRYGHFFQHVVMDCKGLRFNNCLLEDIYRQLTLFLQILTKHWQLLSISFINNDSYQRVRYGMKDWVSDFRQTLIALFLTQNQLKSVKFKRTYFEKTFGIQLLQTIFLSNSTTLKNLELINFTYEYFDDDSNYIATIDVPITSKGLMNLESLSIDYSLFFEDIITSIYKYGSELNLQNPGNLQTLVLFCGLQKNRLYNGIEPSAWKYFATNCPFLKMNVTIEVESENDMRIYVVRHMPIKSLIIKWMPSVVSRLGMTLLHLTESGINKDLEFLSVEVKVDDNLVEDVPSFLQMCPRLSELELHFVCRVCPDCLTSVFEYFLENGPISLKKLNITIKTHCNSSEFSNHYRSISDRYVPLLKEMGLFLTLSSIAVPLCGLCTGGLSENGR